MKRMFFLLTTFAVGLLLMSSNKVESKVNYVREVMTGQHLVVVKIYDKKHGSTDSTVMFGAETRDTFRVIAHTKDSSYVEMDWTMCPDKGCPGMGMYKPNTKKAKDLDILMESLNKRSRSN